MTLKCEFKSFTVIIFIFLYFSAMTMNLAHSKRQSLVQAIRSDSSSDASTPKHQDRIQTLKELKPKKGSVMELIKATRPVKEIKAQSSTLFQSERWNFKPHTETDMRNSLTSSCKITEENPFLRAKL